MGIGQSAVLLFIMSLLVFVGMYMVSDPVAVLAGDDFTAADREALIELTRAPRVEVNDRSVDLAVSRLRGKLGDPPREPRLALRRARLPGGTVSGTATGRRACRRPAAPAGMGMGRQGRARC